MSLTSVQSLRQLLAARFPAAAVAGAGVLATGLPVLDEATGGGLPRGALTEVVCAAPSCGGQLLLGQLLVSARAGRERAALVDAGDTFDPGGMGSAALAHLVWVRVPAGDGAAAAALAATDALARDGNLGLVALDGRALGSAALRRLPATVWYRLQRAVEPAGLVLAVFTVAPAVASARLRLRLAASHSLAALEAPRPQLVAALAPLVERLRAAASDWALSA
jgi:hypothetical protein